MWITLPIAALTTLWLAARSRPWLGLVLGSLGLYVLQATWALVVGGTGSFQVLVTQPAWWQPTGLLAAGAALTGVPALRRLVFGRAAWRRMRAAAAGGAPQAPPMPRWQTELLRDAPTGDHQHWQRAIGRMGERSASGAGVPPARPTSSVSGGAPDPLASATDDLHGALGRISQESAPISLDQGNWELLLTLAAQHGSSLSMAQRVSLVTKAASHAPDAGAALAWRWLSGLEPLIEQLGTDAQKDALLPLLGEQGEAVAAAWTGDVSDPAQATLTREERGGEPVLGLRVTGSLEGVIGAGGATLVALAVPTFDPQGLLGEATEEGQSLGLTCVLIRASSGLSLLSGSHVVERLGSHPLRGPVRAEEHFVGLDHVLGGEAGIGTAAEAALEAMRTYDALGRAALASGASQLSLSEEACRAIVRNVMASETIEAWGMAELGAEALRLRSLSYGAALITDARPLAASEAVVEGIPALPWQPAWHAEAASAAEAPSRKAFDRALTQGLSALVTSAARPLASQLRGALLRLMGGAKTPSSTAGDGVAGLARAYGAVRTAELREGRAQAGNDDAERHLGTCAFLDLVDAAEAHQPIERSVRQFTRAQELAEAYAHLTRRIDQLGGSVHRILCRMALRGARPWAMGPGPDLAESVAAALVSNPELLRRMTIDLVSGPSAHQAQRSLRNAARLAAASRVPIAAVKRAQELQQLPADAFEDVLDLAIQRRIISSVDAIKVRGCMAAATEVFSHPSGSATSEQVRRTA